jgi:hypothetical protein
VKKLVPVAIVAGLAWFAYGKYQVERLDREASAAEFEANETLVEDAQDLQPERPEMPERSESRFTCDGRTRCTQMTSCDEARYFIEHCPNTKMDGDDDGVPCEDQWCNHLR